MIISPWGDVVARLGGEWKEPEIATADIDLDLVRRTKIGMPLLRRKYGLHENRPKQLLTNL